MEDNRRVIPMGCWTPRRADYVNEVIKSTNDPRNSFSDIHIMLEQVSEDTGYDLQFLCYVISEYNEEDFFESFEEYVESVIITAYEFDY